jgi:transcriptional regulator with XRE-family HTH domain
MVVADVVRLTRLRTLRLRRALTQQQLAEKAGVSRPTIARLEAGLDDPYPTTVRKLADALGVEPDALMEPLAE